MSEKSTLIKCTKEKNPNPKVFKDFGGLISLVKSCLLLPI